MQEAATLLRQGLTADSNSATRAIGYRQVILFLEACLADPGHLSAKTLVQCVRDMQSASRKFCHRQFTWFRGDDMYSWVSAGEGPQAPLDEIVRQYTSDGPHQGSDICAWLCMRARVCMCGREKARQGRGWGFQ